MYVREKMYIHTYIYIFYFQKLIFFLLIFTFLPGCCGNARAHPMMKIVLIMSRNFIVQGLLSD